MKTTAFRMAKPDATLQRLAEEAALRQLLEAVAQNLDRDAFSKLFDRIAPRLKSFMLRKGAGPDLSEDLVQETMIAVWTKAGLYDPAKGAVLTWIFTIARNLRIDRLRRDPVASFVDIDDYDAASDEPSAEEVLVVSQERAAMARALSFIPEEQKRILILSYVDGVPQSAIAEQLNLPLGTVKSRMRLAYGHLRKSLEHLT